MSRVLPEGTATDVTDASGACSTVAAPASVAGPDATRHPSGHQGGPDCAGRSELGLLPELAARALGLPGRIMRTRPPNPQSARNAAGTPHPPGSPARRGRPCARLALPVLQLLGRQVRWRGEGPGAARAHP